MKKYLAFVAVVATVSACQTMDAWFDTDLGDSSTKQAEQPLNESQTVINYIIDQSPTSPNAKPEAEALRKRALRIVFLSNDITNDAPRALNEINRAIDFIVCGTCSYLS